MKALIMEELEQYAGCDGLYGLDLMHITCTNMPNMELWKRMRTRETEEMIELWKKMPLCPYNNGYFGY